VKIISIFVNLDMSCRATLQESPGAYVVEPLAGGAERRWKLLMADSAKGEGHFGDLEEVCFKLYLEVAPNPVTTRKRGGS
jgi:hypothetical protein